MRVKVQVEKEFGKPVECRLTEMAAGKWGQAYPETDGSERRPVIEENENRPPDESEILHELLHLGLFGRGFPSKTKIAESLGPDDRAIGAWTYQIANLLQHMLIYPTMKKMGFSPAQKESAQLDQILQHPFPPLISRPVEVNWSIHYAEAVLLYDDASLVNRLESRIASAGWDDYVISLGKELVESIRKSPYSTPKGSVAETMNCLNIIEKGVVVLKSERTGDTVTISLQRNGVPSTKKSKTQ